MESYSETEEDFLEEDFIFTSEEDELDDIFNDDLYNTVNQISFDF